MIKRVKNLGSNPSIALLGNNSIRSYLENYESELSRGISTLCILKIIQLAHKEGIYGYQILKELEEKSNSMLVIEEGRLYPFLKKLEKWGPADQKISLIEARKELQGRKRKFYHLTPEGEQIINHLEGFFSKMLESIAPMLTFDVNLKMDKFLYCPNCSNKIDLHEDASFCPMCGLDIENLRNEQIKGGK